MESITLLEDWPTLPGSPMEVTSWFFPLLDGCFCSTPNISAIAPFAIMSVTMSDNPEEKWIELYTSAMLELKHALMAGRILEARTSIAVRIEKLQGMPGLHARELQALADALCNLRTLERIELHANIDQHRKAALNALEKVESIAPMIERLKSGDDVS
jgi:hypothetical protein